MTFIRFVTGKSSGILSDIPSGILSGISSGISSGILPGISSGICSGIYIYKHIYIYSMYVHMTYAYPRDNYGDVHKYGLNMS